MQVKRRKLLTARIGVVGVGHETYWKQFPGLREELLSKQERFCQTVGQSEGTVVINYGLSDNAQTAAELVSRLNADNLDLIFCDMVTYATSAAFGRIFSQVPVPVVIVALQDCDAMEYETLTTHRLLYCDDICAVPEYVGVSARLGKPAADVILGRLDSPKANEQISDWISIARVLHDLRRARIGILGHVLESMLDMHADPTALSAAFGIHLVQCEPEDIERFYRNKEDGADSERLSSMKRGILDFFDTPEPVADPITTKLTDADLEVAARAAVSLEKFIAAKNLDGLAYYYEGTPDSAVEEVMTNLIVGNSLLTAAGFPMCGEFDVKTCIAMLIFDRLEIGGSFAEFHPFDFTRNRILVGHDGPHHLNIADRKPSLRSLKAFHGKPGHGASVEFSIRKGPITMLSIGVGENGKFKFVVAEGESTEGPILPTGNTITHGYFGDDVVDFVRRWVLAGPTHHFALGIGSHAKTIEKLAAVLKIECTVVRTND